MYFQLGMFRQGKIEVSVGHVALCNRVGANEVTAQFGEAFICQAKDMLHRDFIKNLVC